MNKYLRISVILAALSCLFAGGILLNIVGDFFNLANATATDRITAISGISTAISAIFGLIIGSMAIIAVIEAEKSEVKAIEAFKLDLVALVNLLYGLRNRCLLYTSPESVNYSYDLFQFERERLQAFLNSSSGFALHLWAIETKEIKDLDLNTDLASLIDWMTLKTENHAQVVFNQVMFRSNELVTKLTYIKDKDLKKIYSKLEKIGGGLDTVRTILETDTFSTFVKEMREDTRREHYESLKLPTPEKLAKVIQRARETIGGKTEQTIMHFINAAQHGDKSSLHTYYELVRQLHLDDEANDKQDAESGTPAPGT